MAIDERAEEKRRPTFREKVGARVAGLAAAAGAMFPQRYDQPEVYNVPNPVSLDFNPEKPREGEFGFKMRDGICEDPIAKNWQNQSDVEVPSEAVPGSTIVDQYVLLTPAEAAERLERIFPIWETRILTPLEATMSDDIARVNLGGPELLLSRDGLEGLEKVPGVRETSEQIEARRQSVHYLTAQRILRGENPDLPEGIEIVGLPTYVMAGLPNPDFRVNLQLRISGLDEDIGRLGADHHLSIARQDEYAQLVEKRAAYELALRDYEATHPNPNSGESPIIFD
jgi:hypothetical protein